MLDLGGGEWLAKLPARAARTVATESWPPNVTIAGRRLASLGIEVVAVEPAPDNVRLGEQPAPPLPFADGAFDLICARHESFVPDEIARVLTPGGSFITQQVADEPFGLYQELLGLEPGPGPWWTPERATAQLRRVGLRIDRCVKAAFSDTFADVGALAWYLHKVPSCVPGFPIDRFRQRLCAIDRRIRANGPLTIELLGFLVVASKP